MNNTGNWKENSFILALDLDLKYKLNGDRFYLTQVIDLLKHVTNFVVISENRNGLYIDKINSETDRHTPEIITYVTKQSAT